MDKDLVKNIDIDSDKQIQLRECHLVSYDVEPNEMIFSMLGVKEYAYILHDKDYDENGVLKKSHYHVYLYFHKKKDINVIAKTFNIQTNLVEFVKYKIGLIRYFIHLDDEDKYQYSEYDIVSNFNYFDCLELGISDSQFITMILSKINNNDIKNFKDLVILAASYNKIDLVSKRAYFFKILINER